MFVTPVTHNSTYNDHRGPHVKDFKLFSKFGFQWSNLAIILLKVEANK